MNTIVAEMPKTNAAGGNAGKAKGPDDGKQVKFDEVLKGQKEHTAEKDKKQDFDTDDRTAAYAGAQMLPLPCAEGAAQAIGDMGFILPVPEGTAENMAETIVSESVDTAVTAVMTDDAGRQAEQSSGHAVMTGCAGIAKDVKESDAKDKMPVTYTENTQDSRMPAPLKAEQSAAQQVFRLIKEPGVPAADERRDNPEISAEAVKSSALAGRTADYAPAAREITTAPKPAHNQDIRPEYMDMLKSDIVRQIVSGKQQFEIQLHPDNLGTLVIKASCEAGKAVISIVCSEAKTMQAMSQQARELAGIMEARTGNETEVIVERPAEDYLQQQQQEQNSRGQDREPDRQQRDNRKDEFHENFDFLQQLRLGLA